MVQSFINGVLDAIEKGIVKEEEATDIIRLHYLSQRWNDILDRDLFVFQMRLFLKKDKSFKLNPIYLKTIHSYVFNGLVNNPGEYRTRNISRKEDCLHLRSVIYAPHDLIKDYLTYDFGEEQKKNYKRKSTDERTVMLSKFVSNIWQAHPFNDGNTRTDMIFLQKYLDKLEIDHDNQIFENNFTYFRNALVRNNSNTIGWIPPTSEYLHKFIYNYLMCNTETLDIKETYVPEEKMILKKTK